MKGYPKGKYTKEKPRLVVGCCEGRPQEDWCENIMKKSY